MMLEYPRSLMRERSVEWNLSGSVVTPGQTGSEIFPVVRHDGGGLWIANLNEVSLSSIDLTKAYDFNRAWRAIRTACQGGARPIIVPRNDVLQPWPVVGGATVDSYGSIPHSDGSLFSDGSGYYQSVIKIRTVAAAVLGATQMRVRIEFASNLRGGECFSVLHDDVNWRLYEISTVIDRGGGEFDIDFEPTLRGDVAADTYLEFDRPRCLMRLPDPRAMIHRLEVLPFPRHDAFFMEAFE